MNAVRLILILTTAMVVMGVVSYSSPAAASENFVRSGCDTWNRGQFAMQMDEDRVADISACQYECRMRYGPAPPTGHSLEEENPDLATKRQLWRTSQYSSPNLYWQCMNDCQQRFWRQFEEKTEGSGRGR